MRKNIKRNIKIFRLGLTRRKSFFLLFLITSIYFFSSGCASNVEYRKSENTAKDYHIIKKGETLNSIARKYKISPKRLIQYNRISNPKDIEIGEKIYLPFDEKAASSSKVKKHVKISKGKIPAMKFGWPVKGPVTSKFGFRFGIPHKGVDLGVPLGTKVLAAYDGEVALVESRPRGLGNVVILRHENDFMTVYGHNSKILVKEEQKVKKGQPISLSGSSGWSTGPHLHFEIRYKGDALDPLDYLP